MEGYHTVKLFPLRTSETTLPDGYKPFAVVSQPGRSPQIVARKWHRIDAPPRRRLEKAHPDELGRLT